MLRSLYDRLLQIAAHPHALPWLAAVSFAESSVFPIPPDVLLIPMILARRDRTFIYATICLVASVLGGLLGYAIGHWGFEAVGRPVLTFYGYADAIGQFERAFAEYGWWIIVLKGATPIPYKLVTIASGAASFDLVEFTTASILSRGIRFYAVALLLWWFGPPIRRFVEERLGMVALVSTIVLVGGFVIVRYIF
ncbi:MAG: DedA family protein [Alphaproteobacteria bacterium]|nr:DedA family protein [Alphaproteobacteria bacterium]